jgi:uncharacterized membrane protein
MNEFDLLWLARALHVVGVVLWIGGVAFVTTVLLPVIRRDFAVAAQLPEFERHERAFGRQARWTTQLVGASGLYLVWKLDLWARFAAPGYGWMHAMLGVYLLFTLLLFVIEPLFFHRLLRRLAARHPAWPMAVLLGMHRLLLVLGLLTVAAAMAGAHGWNPAA